MGEKERILLVDDESANRKSLTRLLEMDGHTVVAEAASVSDVQDIVHSDIDFSLAIVDGWMQRQNDGETSAKILRKQRPEAKILALSLDKQTFGDVNLLRRDGPDAVLKAIREI